MADLGWMTDFCHLAQPHLAAPVSVDLAGHKVAVATDGTIVVAVHADDVLFPAPTWATEAHELITGMLSARVENVGVNLNTLREWCGRYVPVLEEFSAPGKAWWRPGLIAGRPVNRNLIARGLAHLEGGVGRMGWHSVVGADQEARNALYIDRPGHWRLIVLGLAGTYADVGVEAATWEEHLQETSRV